jgi:ankyrin repeat protein
MSQKREAQVSAVELQQEHSQDQESTNKRARNTDGKEQQQQQQQQQPGLNVNCKQSMRLPPPLQADDPIITQFRPVQGQWELNDDNINRIEPRSGKTILHNYCDHINTTPLEVYRYLIETKGCDVNLQNKYNDIPLRYAFRSFDPNNGGDINVLDYLLNQTNVNVNTKGWNGDNLLHTACENINRLPLEIFQHLIQKHGCDINAQNDSKDTPLRVALLLFDPNYGGDISVLQCLFDQRKAHVNTKNEYSYTILHEACENINTLPLDVFKLLIETMGCDVNAQNNDKDTPLHIAFHCFNPYNSGNIKTLTYLINQTNANVNIKGKDGHTILHLACICNIHDFEDDMDSEDDSDDDFTNSEENLDNHQEAKAETFLCQIVEIIADRCVQQVLDETTP